MVLLFGKFVLKSITFTQKSAQAFTVQLDKCSQSEDAHVPNQIKGYDPLPCLLSAPQPLSLLPRQPDLDLQCHTIALPSFELYISEIMAFLSGFFLSKYKN